MVTANQSIQISRMKKEIGEAKLILVLMALITETLMYVKHDSKHWNPKTIGSCAEMLISSFWMFKINEFTLAFKQGINGEYGKIYGNIAYVDMVEWLNLYDAEKSKQAEYLAKRNQGAPDDNSLQSDEVIESYRAFYKEWQDKILAKSQEDEESNQQDKIKSLNALIPTLHIGELRALVRQLVNDKRPSEEIELVSNRINELTQLTID